MSCGRVTRGSEPGPPRPTQPIASATRAPFGEGSVGRRRHFGDAPPATSARHSLTRRWSRFRSRNTWLPRPIGPATAGAAGTTRGRGVSRLDSAQPDSGAEPEEHGEIGCGPEHRVVGVGHSIPRHSAQRRRTATGRPRETRSGSSRSSSAAWRST